MSRFFHRQLGLPLALLLFLEASAWLHAQPPVAATNTASAPVLNPPLVFFRELLALNPAQREQHLAQWTPEKRARLLAKISEYEAMTPSAREESLIATELHWYLSQFLTKSSTNSGIELSQVPEPYRQMVSDRLNTWKILPPPLQQDVLAHETTRDFFLLGGARARTNLNNVPWTMIPPPLRQELFRLDVLPPDQRQQSYTRFQGFFELTAVEKKAVLDTLPAIERQQIEKTIADLNHLPPEQRNQALRSLGQLANCTEQQRSEFFKCLGRWKQLSPDEQQLWLKLASHLPPMPPIPPMPPAPSRAPPIPGLSSTTRPSP